MNDQEIQTVWKLSRIMKNAGWEMKSSGSHSAVKAAIEDAVGRMEIDAMTNNATEINVEALKQQIQKCVENVIPASIAITVEEESEEMKLVRQIHEEPINEVNVKIDMTLSQPLDYIVVTLSGSRDEKIGLKLEQNTGSRDASGSDP